MLRAISVLFLATACLSAQAIIQESVAAAAGSTAGAAMGKKVSEALDKVMGATVEAAEQGDIEGPNARPPKPMRELSPAEEAERAGVAPEPAAPAAKPAAPPPAPRADTSVAEATLAIFGQTSSRQAEPAEQSPAESSKETLQSVAAGTTRGDLLAQAGAPASRVSIPGADGMEEIYYYQAHGETVGTVRLAEGKVTSVRLSQ